MKALNTVLLLLFLVLLGANALLRHDSTVPNHEFLPEMVRTARFNAYAANPNFPDGQTLRQPEPGTIPRGYLPLHYGTSPEEALRAGRELANPIAVSDANAVERGAKVFSNFCVPCHGPAGQGDGPVAFRGYPAPPSLHTERTLKMKDGQMFHILTYGQKNMPSYAAQVSREDRWNVILYVRSLQQKAQQAAPVAPKPGEKQ